jgi:hypothetical protein
MDGLINSTLDKIWMKFFIPSSLPELSIGGYTPIDPYAASYELFKTLGDEYGGLSLYPRFFRGLRNLKSGLVSTNVAVLELGLAAGTDLSLQLTSWGFELVDLSSSHRQATSRGGTVRTAIALMLVLLVAAVMIVGRRCERKRAELDDQARY